MVVRHYHASEEDTQTLTPYTHSAGNHMPPAVPLPLTPGPKTPAYVTSSAHVTSSTHVTSTGHLTPTQGRSRLQQLSSTCSEPATDTPKKPPRPKDSVLRERCKSSNELDQHFKTVHNPKRLSQIYGDPNLYLGLVGLE